MAPPCSICTHDEKDAINRALFSTTSLREIARQYGVDDSSLSRHRANHLGPAAANAIARVGDVDAERLAAWAVGLHERTIIGLLKAEKEEDWSGHRGYIAEARRNLELIGRMAGVIDGPTINVDARRQLAVLGGLTEEELRGLLVCADEVVVAGPRELGAAHA